MPASSADAKSRDRRTDAREPRSPCGTL